MKELIFDFKGRSIIVEGEFIEGTDTGYSYGNEPQVITEVDFIPNSYTWINEDGEEIDILPELSTNELNDIYEICLNKLT